MGEPRADAAAGFGNNSHTHSEHWASRAFRFQIGEVDLAVKTGRKALHVRALAPLFIDPAIADMFVFQAFLPPLMCVKFGYCCCELP